MTIVLTQPSAGYIGQGINLFGTTDVALPDPSYDLRVVVSDFTLGLEATSSRSFINNSGSWSTLLGWDSVGAAFQPPQNGLDLGHAVDVQALIFSISPFALVDSGTFSGFFHDPISGYGGLLAKLGGGLTPAQQAQLDQIEAQTAGGIVQSPLIGVTTVVPYTANPINGGVVYDLSLPAGIVTGLTWEAVSEPPYIGGSGGVIQEASRRVIQVVVFHNVFGGIAFADQTFDSHSVTGTCWFDSYAPVAVSVYAWPGYQLNLSWLVLP